MTRRRRSSWLLGCGAAALGLAAIASRPPAPWLDDRGLALLCGAGIGSLLAGLYMRFAPEACDTLTPGQRRRYLREFLPPMLGYVVVLSGSVSLLQRIDGPAWLRTLVALMPVLPIGLAVRAIARHIRAIDELQQRIELEAVSIATALVSLGYLAGGFLQQAEVIDVPAGAAMIWVFPSVCLTYGIAKAVVSRRYA
jgi:hypothetical protein